MDYTEYLPDIDVEDGKARVMNNLGLYMRLLGRFDGAKMAGDITDAIDAGNAKEISAAAHALKGTAANMGFGEVRRVTAEIEAAVKAGESCEELSQTLTEAMASLLQTIGRLLATQEQGTK
jgi:chemotaxis protein histidine kinase CheA